MGKQFRDVSSQYGAPMGRRSYVNDEKAKVKLFRVNVVDGDYDDGGAYWGFGRDSQALYCASADGAECDGEGVQLFIRANSRDDAKRQILELHPGLRFYR